MFTRLALLPIGLFVIWCFVCRQWYVCHIKQVCPVEQADEDTVVIEEDNRPLVFRWSDPSAITRPTFPAYRDNIVKKLPDKQLLEIVGLFFKDEPAPPGFPNMGLARAAKVKELLTQFLPAERMFTSSRMTTEREGVRTGLFESCEFNYIKESTTPKDTVVIHEVDNTITILFPFAKATKEPDPRVDKYLGELAERLKLTTETVSITGHTDDSGSAELNMRLGTARAKHIQDILLSKGIAQSRLSIDTKGESQPVADNTTQEGSRQNRRAVLVLNKKQ